MSIDRCLIYNTPLWNIRQNVYLQVTLTLSSDGEEMHLPLENFTMFFTIFEDASPLILHSPYVPKPHQGPFCVSNTDNITIFANLFNIRQVDYC